MDDIMYKNQDLGSLGIKRRSILSVHRADAESVHYLADAKAEEEAASCVR